MISAERNIISAERNIIYSKRIIISAEIIFTMENRNTIAKIPKFADNRQLSI